MNTYCEDIFHAFGLSLVYYQKGLLKLNSKYKWYDAKFFLNIIKI